MYEYFEHTADLGLRVRSPELNALFADAGEALTAAMVEDAATIEPREAQTIRLKGDDRAYLLLDWLKDLLLQFELDRRLFRRFDVNVRENGLEATAWGEPFDPRRHLLSHEVKAITSHGLRVEPDDGGWFAEVIVDI